MKSIEYCPKCHGSGVIPVGQGTEACNRCSGDGQLETGLLESTDLEATVSEIKDIVNKILEIVAKGKP